MAFPTIKKVQKIIGKTIVFRNIQISDASFVWSLRTNEKKSRHLSSVSNQLLDQETWIMAYSQRENEVYFIIEDKLGESLGTVRLYDSNQYSFCWGSWIIKDGAPPSTAIESALMVYSYALDSLGFLTAHFQVNKENERVCAFHERFGAKRIAENETENKYTISNEEIRASMQRYKRYLLTPLVIENK